MNLTRSGSCDRGVYGGGGPHPVNPTRSGSNSMLGAMETGQ